MLGIFKKKVKLSDTIIQGVDIHNHILPSIDDGAKDIEDSIKLINGLRDLNIVHAIATPHIMSGFFDNTPQTIKQASQKLSEQLVYTDFSFQHSAEYMMDDQFKELLQEKQLLTHGHQYILVEMSYAYETPQFEQLLFEAQSAGYHPIVAHPERYNYWDIDYDLERLKQKNISFQLNALSLGNYYGSRINKKALKWLKAGIYTFIGTDLHHDKHLNALKNLEISSKIVEEIQQLWENNRKLL